MFATVTGVVETMRPHQAAKSVFVFASFPFLLNESWKDVWKLIAVFILFYLAASTVYLFNDMLDIEKDRAHPIKCNRPLAAGRISVPVALVAMVAITIIALCLSWFLSVYLMLLVGLYLLCSHLYSLRLKHTPFWDVLLVGSFYSLRVVAGFTVVGLYPPSWWEWVVMAGILAMSLEIGKRKSEVQTVSEEKKTRTTIAFYQRWSGKLYLICSVAILGLYPFVAWVVHPVFVSSVVLVGAGLYLFWGEVLRLTHDTHPMKVVLRSRQICVVVVVFSAFFVIAARLP